MPPVHGQTPPSRAATLRIDSLQSANSLGPIDGARDSWIQQSSEARFDGLHRLILNATYFRD